MRESLRRFGLRAGRACATVRSFDAFEDAARRLLVEQMPLDGQGIAPGSAAEPRLLVVGDGVEAVTVVSVAARLGHFANGSRLAVGVAAEHTLAWSPMIARHYPALPEVVSLEVFGASLQDEAGRLAIGSWLRRGDRAAAVVLCPPDDASAVAWLSWLLQLIAGTGIPVAVRIRYGDGLQRVLIDQGGDTWVVPFGANDGVAWEGLLEDGDREEMAKVAHLAFVEVAQGKGRSPEIDRALAEWSALVPEDYKQSNRHQVDHIWVKLRALDCELAPVGDSRPAVDWAAVDIEPLARMEHARWCAERRLAGWSYAAGTKDDRARTSPHLVPWSQLDDSVRDYDRSAVLKIPNLARAGGRKICRR